MDIPVYCSACEITYDNFDKFMAHYCQPIEKKYVVDFDQVTFTGCKSMIWRKD